MNVMGPMSSQQRDFSGAHQMLSSAFALSKHMSDLPTQLATLEAVHSLYSQCVAPLDPVLCTFCCKHVYALIRKPPSDLDMLLIPAQPLWKLSVAADLLVALATACRSELKLSYPTP